MKIETEFTGLPLRKLQSLLNEGWCVSGVYIQRTQEDGVTKRGACTAGGMVLWWQPEQERVIAPSVREVMQQALEALEEPDGLDDYNRSISDLAITALREALETPENQLDDINVADMVDPEPAQQVTQPKHKYSVNLPDHDDRKVKLSWWEHEESNGVVHHRLYIAVTEAQPARQEPSGYECYAAIRDGGSNAAEDEYFASRPAHDHDVSRTLFRHGFDRGYDRASAQQSPDALHLAAMDLARKQAQRIAELEQQLAARAPLTHGEIVDLCDGTLTTWEQVKVARAIEAAHGITKGAT